MSTAGHANEEGAASVASRLTEAGFVRLCCVADGDALCATGAIARALAAADVPFQASVSRIGAKRTPATEADLTVRVGSVTATAPMVTTASADVDGSPSEDDALVIQSEPRPASAEAFAIAEELGGDTDPILALTGTVAARIRDGRFPSDDEAFASDVDRLSEAARDRGALERQPGIATPTSDAVDGLTHTTLAHAPFSGSTEATRERCGVLADREDAGRAVASLLALATVGARNSPPRAARALEHALRPAAPGGPLATVGGFADVLCALAIEAPGIALALALGHDVREAALDGWRVHSRRAHTALENGAIACYNGLCVARLETGADAGRDGTDAPNRSPMPVATIARLVRDFRSPEPVALVVGEHNGAIAAVEHRSLGTVTRDLAAANGGRGGGTERCGEVHFTDGIPDTIVEIVRNAL